MGITKASSASAKRDLTDLFEKGILEKQGEGRNVKYELIFPEIADN